MMVSRAGWILVLALGGCSLYYSSPAPDPGPPVTHTIDAGAAPDAAPQPDAKTCPAAGTYAEIGYPADGATNVATPVPIRVHVFIPNTLDGKGMYLSDANGQMVGLDHYDASCSVPLSQTGTGTTQDESWTECYDLPPDQQFTWHVWITCYDASGIHEIATSTFHTAP